MNTSIRLLSVLAAFAVWLPAAATETAPAVVAAPAATAPAVASQAAPVAAATPAAKPADAASAKTGADRKGAVAKVPPGYKSRVVDGETRYCRKDTPLGSRFPTEVCMTPDQYQQSLRQAEALRTEITVKQKSYSITQ